MDKIADDYYNEQPFPMGSTDRKCVIDTDSLVAYMGVRKSELATLRTEKEVNAWAKTLAAPYDNSRASLDGLRVCQCNKNYTHRRLI